MSKAGQKEAERFWSKVEVRDDGCWVRATTGRFFSSKADKLVSPRRWAWENVRGTPPDPDTILRATCGTKECVNPDHVTVVWKGRRSETHCSRDHPINDENGYWSKDKTWVCRICKREHQRTYRQDPDFRARQAAASRRYIQEHPEYAEAKKARQRKRYAEDSAYRDKIRATGRERRRQLKRESE